MNVQNLLIACGKGILYGSMGQQAFVMQYGNWWGADSDSAILIQQIHQSSQSPIVKYNQIWTGFMIARSLGQIQPYNPFFGVTPAQLQDIKQTPYYVPGANFIAIFVAGYGTGTGSGSAISLFTGDESKVGPSGGKSLSVNVPKPSPVGMVAFTLIAGGLIAIAVAQP